jgi:hypothetical protein
MQSVLGDTGQEDEKEEFEDCTSTNCLDTNLMKTYESLVKKRMKTSNKETWWCRGTRLEHEVVVDE